MDFFKNGTGWCRGHDPNKKKATSVKHHAPVFRKQDRKRSSLQALEPGNRGLKPNRQGFKPQAIIYQIQYPVARVQAHKLRVRGPGNEDK
tara:strand:+ start:292 stop:561 length:270 start_codon:yes stop_codon:yes gene_type:complete